MSDIAETIRQRFVALHDKVHSGEMSEEELSLWQERRWNAESPGTDMPESRSNLLLYVSVFAGIGICLFRVFHVTQDISTGPAIGAAFLGATIATAVIALAVRLMALAVQSSVDKRVGDAIESGLLLTVAVVAFSCLLLIGAREVSLTPVVIALAIGLASTWGRVRKARRIRNRQRILLELLPREEDD